MTRSAASLAVVTHIRAVVVLALVVAACSSEATVDGETGIEDADALYATFTGVDGLRWRTRLHPRR